MKHYKFFAIIVGIFLLTELTSCIFNINGIKGNGNITKENRIITDFSDLEVSGAYKVYLTQGSSTSLTIEGDENLMQYVTIKNVDNDLIIGSKENLNPTKKMIIYLTFNKLNSIDLSGACELISQDQLTFDEIKLEGSGACEYDMNVVANTVNFDFSGASEIKMKGRANKVNFDASGASRIKCFNFVIQECNVDLSGASEAKLNVIKNLSIDISGASLVEYKGGAKIVKQETSGASSIRSKE